MSSAKQPDRNGQSRNGQSVNGQAAVAQPHPPTAAELAARADGLMQRMLAQPAPRRVRVAAAPSTTSLAVRVARLPRWPLRFARKVTRPAHALYAIAAVVRGLTERAGRLHWPDLLTRER